MRCRSFVVLLTLAIAECIAAQTITTIAGDGRRAESPDGAMAAGSPLNIGESRNVAFAFNGDLCFAEDAAFRVRCIERTTGRLVTIVKGEGAAPPGGRTTPAFVPREIAFDLLGNLFINDYDHHVRKVDRKTGIMTEAAGNAMSRLEIHGITFDGNDNLVLSDDNGLHRLDFSTGLKTSIAGGWQRSASPRFDKRGNVFFSSSCDNLVLRVDARTGLASTVAGVRRRTTNSLDDDRRCPEGDYRGDGGPAIEAELRRPTSLAVDGAGNVFICDGGNHAIRRVDARTGVITTVAGGVHGASFSGDGGPASKAGLSSPSGLGLDGLGNLFIIDSGNGRIRKVEGVAAR